MMDRLADLYKNVENYVSLLSVNDLADILLVSVVIYQVIQFVRKSNALKVLTGILLLLAVMWGAELLQLQVIGFLLRNTMQVGLIALVIIFQPELRRMLERVGSSGLPNILGKDNPGEYEKVIMQTVEACSALSWSREGALIIFERNVLLSDVVKTGTLIDAEVSSELMKNVFYPKAPLHDGALVIRRARVAAAGCMLPLSTNQNLSRELGMRHRAGIGMSENSDAVCLIVSEETGSISVAIGGMLKRHLTQDTLEKLLRNELMPSGEEKRGRFSRGLKQLRRKRDE